MSFDRQIKSIFGYCYFAFETDSVGSYVHIYDLYIYPEYRKQGKARELLKTAINGIRQLGYTEEIHIVASPTEDSIDKLKLVSFYRSMGLVVYDCYM